MKNLYAEFTKPLLDWYILHGRKNLPWQDSKAAYRIWVSEIMLQQTQVQTVIPYFNRFMARFPTIETLSSGEEDDVLSLWSGLGYYSRARNLHKSAKIIVSEYQGLFPSTPEKLIALPGIGKSTASAILSLAYNLPYAILDGNVKRVLTRFFRIEGQTNQSQINKELWALAHQCMSTAQCSDYTQAIMDLGATCCTLKNPQCQSCPLQKNCQAHHHEEQHLYPTKKPKKSIPTCTQHYLVLTNADNCVYLEKRPPKSIWGGLWCFPSIDLEICPMSHIEEVYGLQGISLKPLTPMTHRLTHLTLDIHCSHIQTVKKTTLLQNGQWFNEEALSHLGLAKPTKVILDEAYADTLMISESK